MTKKAIKRSDKSEGVKRECDEMKYFFIIACNSQIGGFGFDLTI